MQQVRKFVITEAVDDVLSGHKFYFYKKTAKQNKRSKKTENEAKTHKKKKTFYVKNKLEIKSK